MVGDRQSWKKYRDLVNYTWVCMLTWAITCDVITWTDRSNSWIEPRIDSFSHRHVIPPPANFIFARLPDANATTGVEAFPCKERHI